MPAQRKHPEIPSRSHILKLRPGTVASRLRRARAAFKAFWNEQAPQMPAPHFSPEAS